MLGGIMGILLSYFGQIVLNMAAYRLFELGQMTVAIKAKDFFYYQ
jgi:hypothetical protein